MDEELINTISKWRRFIFAELNGHVSIEEISNFFNAIIFTRAYEDSRTKIEGDNDPILIKMLWSRPEENSFSGILLSTFEALKLKSYPDQVVNKSLFSSINKLGKDTLNSIFQDFYTSSKTPYKYDFSIISKHALSKIYEKYVSILSTNDESPIQYNLFNQIANPNEERNKLSGSYYTPQFIARFFSRFIEKKLPALYNGKLAILEPAVGSGIFLRTLLENISPDFVQEALKNITGIDKNSTACDAAKLSLCLLYLTKNSMLPTEKINIIQADTLDFFSKKQKQKYDIIISNPPFVNYGIMPDNERNKVKTFLAEYAYNKSDLYLPFIKIAIDYLKKGGLGLYVLPDTFLVTESAKLIRKHLAEECDILCIIDLSSIDYKIFEDARIYPILLIFQKKSNKGQDRPLATLATIKAYVGKALTDVLTGEETSNISYNIFNVPQEFFKKEKWNLLSPTESSLEIKFSKYKKINDFCDVRTGFASGLSDAFIIPKNQIPSKEKDIYIPYLSDREMNKYSAKKDSTEYFFYPYRENGTKIEETELQNNYPNTYKRLYRYFNTLSQRSEVLKGRLYWWEPNRARKRDFMLVPKIMTPHLVFSPKFSLDINGKYAVARSPFITIKNKLEFETAEEEFLFYFLGILNSPIATWYLSNHSSQYQNGFMMIEPHCLKEIPVVDPKQLPRAHFLKYISLIKNRYLCNEQNSSFDKIYRMEKEIDDITMNFYQLSKKELDTILGNYGDFN